MNHDQLMKKGKKFLINFSIIWIILSGIENIVSAWPCKFKALSLFRQYDKFIHLKTILIHKDLSIITGLILIFLSYRLYKRMKVAWMIMLIILPVSLVLKITKYHTFINVPIIVEAFVICTLIAYYRDFNRESDPISLKVGITIALGSMGLIVIHSTIGLFLLKNQYIHIQSFTDAFIKSIKLLFYMDTSTIEPRSKIAQIYGESIIAINIICLILSLILILKPLIYQRAISNMDRIKVREYLMRYAHNPISYVAIEKDKKYFFSRNVDGVIAYVVCSGVAVCVADPICNEQDMVILLSEFISFCKANELSICFYHSSEKYLYEFTKMGFGVLKYGEEAMFQLDTYSLSGKKTAKVRQAINNANRLGIQVLEYKPLEKRDPSVEEEIKDVSKEWLSFKKSGELSFMLGSISLEQPMDRRYFIAMDENKKIQGFVVFVPFLGGAGYYADVTRRRKNAPIGVMEKIIISAFDKMKEEGVLWGSLGLAPLVNVRENEERKQVTSRILEFIYENLNQFYGFKTLYQYKKKYGPTAWNPKFIVYYPAVFTPKIAYAILKATNPRGVKDYLLSQIKLIYNKK